MKPQFTPDPGEIEKVLATIAIASTGNREQDEAHLLAAAVREVRLRHGYCPNGCQVPLRPDPVYPRTLVECPECQFTMDKRFIT
jgi:hypothetical protein